jgi:hypothetical protein
MSNVGIRQSPLAVRVTNQEQDKLPGTDGDNSRVHYNEQNAPFGGALKPPKGISKPRRVDLGALADVLGQARSITDSMDSCR